MGLKYKKARGQRIKNQSFRRVGLGFDQENVDLWWCHATKKWRPLDEVNAAGGGGSNNFMGCHSVRAFRRRLRKWSAYVPAGVQFMLCSDYVGYDVTGRITRRRRRVNKA